MSVSRGQENYSNRALHPAETANPPPPAQNGQKMKKAKKNRKEMEPISGSYGENVQPPQQFNILGENGSEAKPSKPQNDQQRAKVSHVLIKKCLCERVKSKKVASTLASTSAGIPNPILDPYAEDNEFPDSEVAWRNARRIDNPYQGLFRQGNWLAMFGDTSHRTHTPYVRNDVHFRFPIF